MSATRDGDRMLERKHMFSRPFWILILFSDALTRHRGVSDFQSSLITDGRLVLNFTYQTILYQTIRENPKSETPPCLDRGILEFASIKIGTLLLGWWS